MSKIHFRIAKRFAGMRQAVLSNEASCGQWYTALTTNLTTEVTCLKCLRTKEFKHRKKETFELFLVQECKGKLTIDKYEGRNRTENLVDARDRAKDGGTLGVTLPKYFIDKGFDEIRHFSTFNIYYVRKWFTSKHKALYAYVMFKQAQKDFLEEQLKEITKQLKHAKSMVSKEIT